MAIRILDAALVGRIAAGEVVERPVSVAKELFENALDANSTSITIEFSGGGIDYLRVTDNGCGIPAEEVRMAFENHATSKISSAEQLDDIRTLGFRGEALPSIAAVSKVICTTRRRGAQSGVKLIVEGGRVVSLSEAGCPEGTTLEMRDLFFNTPVRRTFLKKPSYEAGALTDAVARLLLGNPGVAVRLINAGRTVFHSFGDGNLRHAALAVYGREVATALTEIDQAEGALSVKGLIGVGDLARSTRSQQAFFINGRAVRCPLVQQALEAACQGRVTVGMHPICMLNLCLPPAAVDVNVHPNKLEVRFRDEAAVRTSIEALFRRVFSGERLLDMEQIAAPPPSIAPKVTVERIEIEEETKVSNLPTGPAKEEAVANAQKRRKSSVEAEQISLPEPPPIKEADAFSPREAETLSLREVPVRKSPANEQQSAKAQSAPAPGPVAPEQREASPAQSAPAFRVLGVAFNTYLLVEAGNRFLMIDQHAAHERILYEKYAGMLNAGEASQQLLTPVLVSASKKEMAQVEEARALLLEAGFDVEPFGERELAVRAVPFVLGRADVQPLFMELIDQLDQLKYATADRRRAQIIQMSCKHAVKGGDHLSQGEIAELIAAMQKTEAPATCPHGRPVLRTFSKGEIEKMFKRQQ